MATIYESRVSEESKMRTPDRILELKVMAGKKPLDTLMRVDPRLFEGENKLHAIMDLPTSLWTLKYDKGSVPPILSGRYTGFRQAFDAAKNYYNQRNIEITQV